MRKEVIAHKDPKSPISEIFRTLRTNIQFMNASKKMKTILVTSTFPGEGKSWVTANLAVTFAQAGKKVVLIDADMRKGRQYVIFGASPRPGLSNYLSQIEMDENETVSENIVDYIQETEVDNLYLMPAGNIPPNPSELLVSAQMVQLLEELKNICDVVIVDGTPCELVTDSVILSRIVDSTIIVTAHKITKKDALERVVKNIQNVGGNLAGVVINKMPISGKKYEEKYYYYGETQNTNTVKRKSDFSKTNESLRRNRIEETNKQRVARTLAKDKEEMKPKRTNSRPNNRVNNNVNKNNVHKNDELPKAMKKNANNINKEDVISLERTNDILKQINEYLDQEKKNLKE